MSDSHFDIGVDVGGTFTDLVAIDETGRIAFSKSPTTPQDQSIGVLNGLEDLAGALGLSLAELLSRTDRLVHGSTVATNALLERKGAKVALLTSEGHRDLLEMREGLKPDRYNLRMPPPEPLVPRHLRLPVGERLGPDGAVLRMLDLSSIDDAIRCIREENVEAVTVCYLHSYRNAKHERETGDRLLAALPDVYLSLSSEVLPQIREFERVSTSVVNSYVGPPVRRYLTNLERRLVEAGFAGRLFVILSHGGMMPVGEATHLAVGMVLSGPAGGMAGARRVSELLDTPQMVTFDMGGTSTDISMIADGKVILSSRRGLADQRIALRSLDIASIGAGGGSIAHVDSTGGLQVGPESAGAFPGPAAYGLGGMRATVTDANLVLGYLGADVVLSGHRRLDLEAARKAIDLVAGELGLSSDAAAYGIYRLINTKMADGIRLMTTQRGVDPRRFALLSFGGAAGLHAAPVARELEMTRIIVPTVASVMSAWGMLATDLRYEASQTHIGDAHGLDDASLRKIFADLEDRARSRLESWQLGSVRFERHADMRYGEQIFEIEVDLGGLDWGATGMLDTVTERFHRRHEELYTYSSPGQEVVLVNARVAAVSAARPISVERSEVSGPTEANPVGIRPAFVEGAWHEVPVYAMDALRPGHTIQGPALVEAATTTVLVGMGDYAAVNAYGWLDVTLRPARGKLA